MDVVAVFDLSAAATAYLLDIEGFTKEDHKMRGKGNSNSTDFIPHHICGVICDVVLGQSNKKQVWWKAEDVLEHAAWVKKLTECINQAPGAFLPFWMQQISHKLSMQ